MTSSGLKFEKHAKEILTNIEELRTFLVSNRSAYLDNLHQGIVDHVVSDDQRDKIDAGGKLGELECGNAGSQAPQSPLSCRKVESTDPTFL